MILVKENREGTTSKESRRRRMREVEAKMGMAVKKIDRCWCLDSCRILFFGNDSSFVFGKSSFAIRFRFDKANTEKKII